MLNCMQSQGEDQCFKHTHLKEYMEASSESLIHVVEKSKTDQVALFDVLKEDFSEEHHAVALEICHSC